MHKTIEDPESYQARGSYREARKWVDGVLAEVGWHIVGKGSKRTAVLKTAYPIREKGLCRLKVVNLWNRLKLIANMNFSSQ